MSLEQFTRMVTEFYKDDVEKIPYWNSVYCFFNEKCFTSEEDCTPFKVKEYLKERKTLKSVLQFIITEGKTLKSNCPKAIKALANVLTSNRERRAEIRFSFYFLQFEQLIERSSARSFNNVLDIRTLFTKKDSNQKMYVELVKQYRMIIAKSVTSKNQKTSVNQNYPVEALIKKMKLDLKQSQESYENPTFYKTKHKSLIGFIELLKEKLRISKKQIEMLNTRINDKTLFVPYGMGFSPLYESVEGEAKKFGWVTPEPEDQINELTQGQPKPPGDNSDSDGDDDDGDSDGDNDSDYGNDGDDEEFTNIADEHERDQINVAVYDQERNARIIQQEEEDRLVAEAKLLASKNWVKSGSSEYVDKGFGPESSDDGYSSEEFDGGFKKPLVRV